MLNTLQKMQSIEVKEGMPGVLLYLYYNLIEHLWPQEIFCLLNKKEKSCSDFKHSSRDVHPEDCSTAFYYHDTYLTFTCLLVRRS